MTVISMAMLQACGNGNNSASPGPGVPTPTPTPAPTPTPTPTPTSSSFNYIGFFNHLETVPELTRRVNFGVINSYSTDQVEKGLSAAAGTTYKVKIDFSPLLTKPISADSAGAQYVDSTGSKRVKSFSPLVKQKLSSFPSNDRIIELIRPYISIMKRYESNVGTIFIADEPYLNGISKEEMERSAKIVRQELNNAGLKNIKIGVNFAAAMFNADFARLIDQASGDYVRKIDEYYERGIAIRNGTVVDPSFDMTSFDAWVAFIKKSRLTTYDAAGNMYVGGGIPEGFDLVTFDFYMSTILLDGVYDNSLSWFAKRYPGSVCGQYAGRTMQSIRDSLSFFQDGPLRDGESYRAADRKILDDVYECRMSSTLDMMRTAANALPVRFMMISEASVNGSFEFYRNRDRKPDQPKHILEMRAYDEVSRSIRFYSNHRNDFQCGLAFFLYNDAYDESIKLDIYGAASLPSVLKAIYDFSASTGSSTFDHCD